MSLFRIETPLDKKRKADEILAQGKGPLKEMPVEKELEPATFYKEKEQTAEKSPDIKMNRGKKVYKTREFDYDINEDPLYQQYLASAKRNGQAAMTDTMAKVASQTGGIAGSYAVSAGATAYNDYMQRANDIIPELEQIAYSRYQDELARDLKIHEMDEADRWEKAGVDAVLNKYQTEGIEALSEDEVIDLYAGGYYIKDGKVYGKEGELASENREKATKDAATNALLRRYQKLGRSGLSEDEIVYLETEGYYFDGDVLVKSADGMRYATKDEAGKEKYYTAYEDYNLHGWGNMSEKNRLELKKEGFWYDEKSGMITDGVQLYAWGDGTPMENVKNEYFKGRDISYANEMLKENGYTYMDEVLYDPKGQKVMIDHNELWDEAMRVFQSEGYDKLTPLQKAVIDYYGNYDEKKGWVYRDGMAYAGPKTHRIGLFN